MKTRFIVVVTLLIACLAATSAAYDRTPIGTWEWIEYQEEVDSHTYPGDVGYTTQLTFQEDGTYIEFRDEVPVAIGEFTYGESEIYPGQTIPILTITVDGTGETFAYDVFPDNALTIYYGHDGWWPDYPLDRYVRRTAVVSSEQSSWSAIKLLFR